MRRNLRLGGQDIDVAALSNDARKVVALIRFSDERLKELRKMRALLTQAKSSLVDSLEREIIKSRSGVGISATLSD